MTNFNTALFVKIDILQKNLRTMLLMYIFFQLQGQ